jgi:FkbM family methyltransferase
MRAELFYNPLLLLERIGQWATERRRVRKLRGTVASGLTLGHIDSLELLELLKSDPPRVIYDIGANVGTWTLLAKTIFPTAEVHGFEPLDFHCTKFVQLTEKLNGVHLHQTALGEKREESVMRVTSFSDASSLLPLAHSGMQQWQLETVKEVPVLVQRLDDWVCCHKLPPPDLLKLDVQGYEVHALRGAPNCLKHARAVLAEVSFGEFYSGQCRFEELSTFLGEYGYRLHALGHGTHIGRALVQTDALFLRKLAPP